MIKDILLTSRLLCKPQELFRKQTWTLWVEWGVNHHAMSCSCNTIDMASFGRFLAFFGHFPLLLGWNEFLRRCSRYWSVHFWNKFWGRIFFTGECYLSLTTNKYQYVSLYTSLAVVREHCKVKPCICEKNPTQHIGPVMFNSMPC